MEQKAAPRTAKTISNIALETNCSTAPAIPFRMLGVVKCCIKVLKRDDIRCFIQDHLECHRARAALSVIVMVLLMPLDDEAAIRRLAENVVIHVAAGKEVVPEGCNLVGPKWNDFVRNRAVLIITITRRRPVQQHEAVVVDAQLIGLHSDEIEWRAAAGDVDKRKTVNC